MTTCYPWHVYGTRLTLHSSCVFFDIFHINHYIIQLNTIHSNSIISLGSMKLVTHCPLYGNKIYIHLNKKKKKLQMSVYDNRICSWSSGPGNGQNLNPVPVFVCWIPGSTYFTRPGRSWTNPLVCSLWAIRGYHLHWKKFIPLITCHTIY